MKHLLTRSDVLFVLGYMLFPLLGLVTAVLGLFMILAGNRIPGVIVLVLVTQVFVFGAWWALKKRRTALAEESSQAE
ncbi:MULTISPECIES: NF038396 family protein [Arthrobacter]|uniref:Uncharacterized protein n=1 Tax=Arthrobacter woluwensis TaxID=156980 RepID=A0A1H4LZ14_9MICC|nr:MULTISPECIES: NF038396 family protein [Arthrobacter]QTF72344.1 hypothetical protein G8758_10255 [Arthrobacter woluwensis]SEB75505.1 hypothetical protein SAMN04489745_1161 [Arthrobacter woluwensis]